MFRPAFHCALRPRRVSTARLTSHSLKNATPLAPSTPCPDISTPLTRGKYRPEFAHDLRTLHGRRSAGRWCGFGGASPRVTLPVASRLNWRRTGTCSACFFPWFVSRTPHCRVRLESLESAPPTEVFIRQSFFSTAPACVSSIPSFPDSPGADQAMDAMGWRHNLLLTPTIAFHLRPSSHLHIPSHR